MNYANRILKTNRLLIERCSNQNGSARVCIRWTLSIGQHAQYALHSMQCIKDA